MASSTSNLTDKVIEYIANVAPNEFQRLKEDRRKNAECLALINRVIDDYLTVWSSLHGQLQSASRSYVEMVVDKTFNPVIVRRLFTADTFLLSIAQRGGRPTTVETATKHKEDIFPPRRLNTPVDVDWAYWTLCAGIYLDIAVFLNRWSGIFVSIPEIHIPEMTERVAAMISQSALRRVFDALVEAWNRTDSKCEWAMAIYQFLKESDSKGILWKVAKLVPESLSVSDWTKTAAKLAATLVVAFATDGAALIAIIILALDPARLHDKIRNVIKLNQLKQQMYLD